MFHNYPHHFHSDFHNYPHRFHCNFSLSSSHYFIPIFIPTSSTFIVIFHCPPLNTSFWFSYLSLPISLWFFIVQLSIFHSDFHTYPTAFLTTFIVQLIPIHSDFHTYPHYFHSKFSLSSSQYFILIFIPTSSAFIALFHCVAPCTLHSSTHSGWTPDGLWIGTWTPYGLHLQYNQSYIFHDHPPGVHLESA